MANISLVGFPFFSGFFSKDLRLELAITGVNSRAFIRFLIFLSLGLTVGYRIKIMLLSRINFRYSLKVSIIDKIKLDNCLMVFMLIVFRVIAGFFYSKVVLDYCAIISIYAYEKVSFFLFIMVFFNMVYYFNNKRIFSLFKKKKYYFIINLFYLVDVSTYLKSTISNIIYLPKILDFG